MNKMDRTVITTSATAEPVSLAELKRHLRVSTSTGYTAENAYMTDLIGMARSWVEDVTWRKLMPQTVTMYLDQFPSTNEITLPYGNVSSATGVQVAYTNSTNATANLSTANYKVDSVSYEGRVVLNSSGSWPSDTLNRTNPIAVTFKCGYGASSTGTTKSTEVPLALRQAVKIFAADLYENRESVVMGTIVTQVPRGMKALLANYMMKRY